MRCPVGAVNAGAKKKRARESPLPPETLGTPSAPRFRWKASLISDLPPHQTVVGLGLPTHCKCKQNESYCRTDKNLLFLNTMSHNFFVSASPEHLKRERAKARDLRQSQWWKNQLARSVCYHCEQRFAVRELTMDHLIPIARGGMSDRGNCVPSCKTCNSHKGNRTRAELALQTSLPQT